MGRNNGCSRLPQSRSPDHERRRRTKDRGDDNRKIPYAILSTPFVQTAPKHEHMFKAGKVEEDVRRRTKYQVVECTVSGCTLRFWREVFWNSDRGEVIG